jgi:hypothetical protein
LERRGCPGAVVDRSQEQFNNVQARVADVDPRTVRCLVAQYRAGGPWELPVVPVRCRWTYFRTPWGLLMEIVDRSRVADPPALVGPADWRTTVNDSDE